MALSTLWWRAPGPMRAVSSAMVGGGLGTRRWFLNAQVLAGYDRLDPDVHLRRLARSVGLSGAGVAMMTAVDVTTVVRFVSEGVTVLATVGLGWPTWAAPRSGVPDGWPTVPPAGPAAAIGLLTTGAVRPGAITTGAATPGAVTTGTVNLFVLVDAVLGDAALVNLATTATEAKSQALFEAGVPGTGTASDAVCVACLDPRSAGLVGKGPPPAQDGAHRFGGPRSPWGLRVAKAVHRAVSDGATGDHERAVAGGWPRGGR